MKGKWGTAYAQLFLIGIVKGAKIKFNINLKRQIYKKVKLRGKKKLKLLLL